MSDGRDQVVRMRTLNWKEMVLRAWGKDYNKPDTAYEFTGKKFDDPKPADIYVPQAQWED